MLSSPTAPADHPGNIFGNAVVLSGRPCGAGQPSEVDKQEHDTLRIAVGAEGRLPADLSWDFSYARGENNADLLVRDTDKDNFQRALNGLGGADCDPDAGTPGQGDCRCFNPFSSSFSAQPGDAAYNHPSLRDFIIADAPVDARSKMDATEANLSGLLFDLAGGPVGFAVGAQYRRRSLRYRYGPISRRDGFAFLIGAQDFSASGDSYAVYGETRLPLAERLEVTGVLRYEDYGARGGDALDPKATILLRLPAQLSLRGSFSTSFRMPSIFPSQGIRTNFADIDDAGNRTFTGRRIRGNPDLEPETSRAFSVGAAWSPLDNAQLSLDYWNYAFEDALRAENAQAIVDANPDPRIEHTPGGAVSIVHVDFVNADAIDTSGLDLAARAAFAAGFGVLSSFFEAAYLLSCDVTFGGRKIDAMGRLNQNNAGAPNQRFKGNLGLGWSRGDLSGNVFVRHAGGHKDDAGGSIALFATVDANLRVGLGGLLPGNADSFPSLGVINLADQDPPAVNILGSYDPRSADPRGRRAFVKLEPEF